MWAWKSVIRGSFIWNSLGPEIGRAPPQINPQFRQVEEPTRPECIVSSKVNNKVKVAYHEEASACAGGGGGSCPFASRPGTGLPGNPGGQGRSRGRRHAGAPAHG